MSPVFVYYQREKLAPKVTILIPTFNREKYILEALSSAAQQTYRDTEILVIDNCSTDKTVEIAKRFAASDSRVRILVNEQNLGPLLNWKRGLENASGELVKILWSDDLMRENFLAETIPVLTDGVGFVVSAIKIGDGWESSKDFRYDLDHRQKISSSDFINKSLMGASIPVSPGCSLFRKKDLIKNLTLNNELFTQDRFKLNGAGPDLLFFLRACLDYPFVGVVNSTSSFFRDHPGSITVGEKAKLIGLDYLKAKLYFAAMANHRYFLGIFLEIVFRSRKDKEYFKGDVTVDFRNFIGAIEYILRRGFLILKRRLR